MRVFSFCCQLWHIGAIIGFRISPLSLQVKVNTQDPTHGAAVSGFNESALPVQPGTLWVNGSGGGQSCLYGIAACVRCGAFRKTSFTRLVIFHQPLLFHPRLRLRLSLSLFLSPLGPLFTLSKAFSDAKKTHTSKQQHAPSHWHTLIKTETEAVQDTEDSHKQKVNKWPSYLISTVIALSSTAGPFVSLPSDSQTMDAIYT